MRRLLRRMIALMLVFAALWWLLIPALYPITSLAILNARTIQVRAPIDGTPVCLHHEVGDRVAAGSRLLDVAEQQVVKTHLAGLQTRRSELLARIKRLHGDLQALTSAEVSARATQERYRDSLIASLRASIKETKARAEMYRITFTTAAKQTERAKALIDRQALSPAEYDSIKEKESVARQRMAIEEHSLLKLAANLEAAQENSYVLETPYFQQRTDELSLKIPEAKTQLAEARELFTALEEELRQEEQRVEKLLKTTVTSPVSGVIWSRHGNVGQLVKRSEPVYEIAETGSIFVEALLHQRHLSSVGPGSRATINLTGGRTLVGTVRAVRTPGPLDHKPSFALKLVDQDVKQVRVLIDIDAGSGDVVLLIGRHVRVLITDADPAWYDRVVMWLFTHLRT